MSIGQNYISNSGINQNTSSLNGPGSSVLPV